MRPYGSNNWGGKRLFTILEKGRRHAAFRHDGEVLIVEDVTDLLSEDSSYNG
jgi:hypothetical protein